MSIEVALMNTIRAQINATDKAALWAYGAEQFTAIDARQLPIKILGRSAG